ncbi:Hsp20/alpha crystallin family protein [Pedobacter cryophilus]|uniref:Hsp20/alpha crystallin family protein n=1 Tax=Pedobacter cryophilus TaxID=2571271 RepID=A0A4V5NX41_9SPHI|nr:Hsp20/alpha crystallin family protein [Pedobacter cryophilus]TKB97687.1 Hsp20/alpha crystallin family protein [Pedobacter cryophilus]
MTLVKFNDGKKLNHYSTFNHLFDSFLKDEFINERPMLKVPAVNISESENHFHIELAAPGLKKEDFKISIDKDVLKVSSEGKKEENKAQQKINRKEFSYDSFTRSFNLPDLIDHSNIEATYDAGILKIDIAKKEEAKIQTREISIK